ncbi:MAG: dihydropteroate synthase [bacterium]
MKLALGKHTLDLAARPHVMGILNVTPDSFWDGGRYGDAGAALARAGEMAAEGADIIDVGGESTRPGSAPLEVAAEIDRIGPVVERIAAGLRVAISIDTRKAAVAREALGLGAHMINDISGLAFDPGMVEVARESGAPVVVMHMRGTPETMQQLTDYDDVVGEVRRELAERVAFAEARGIRPDRILIDPGIGFAKTAIQNVELLARLDELTKIGKPMVVGPSMKSFMGKTLGLEPGQRAEATVACCVLAAAKGASIFRVHDVAGVARALAMTELILKTERSMSRSAEV